jgi:hypothetical protein
MWIKRLDIYQKLNDDEMKRVKTVEGGILSASCLVICVVLFVTELYRFMKLDVEHIVIVDSFFQDKLDINFELVIPKMQCRYISLRVLDKTGSQQDNIFTNIRRHDLDTEGNIIGTEENGKYEIAEFRKQDGNCLSCGAGGDVCEKKSFYSFINFL